MNKRSIGNGPIKGFGTAWECGPIKVEVALGSVHSWGLK
jgi:hypothetical protein